MEHFWSWLLLFDLVSTDERENYDDYENICICILQNGFPGGLLVKDPLANAGDVDSISGLGRSSGEGNGNALQHSCLGNPMDTGTWGAIVHGVPKESDMT